MSKKNRKLTKNAENETESLYNDVLNDIQKMDGNKNIIERNQLFKIIWKIFYDKSNNLHKIGPKKSSKVYVRSYTGTNIYRFNPGSRFYLDKKKFEFYKIRKIHHNCIESREIKILKEWINENKNTFISALVIELLKEYPNLFD